MEYKAEKKESKQGEVSGIEKGKETLVVGEQKKKKENKRKEVNIKNKYKKITTKTKNAEKFFMNKKS